MKCILYTLFTYVLCIQFACAQNFTGHSTAPDIRDQYSTILNSEFYFADQNGNLWKTDGSGPADLVATITTECSTDILIQGTVGSEVWFSPGNSIYVTDGSVTQKIYTGPGGCGFPVMSIAGGYGFIQENDTLISIDGNGTTETLFTLQPTQNLKSFVVDNEFYFFVYDTASPTTEFWKSGGTVASTTLEGTGSFPINSVTNLASLSGQHFALSGSTVSGESTVVLSKLDTTSSQFATIESIDAETINSGNLFLESVGGQLFLAADLVNDSIPIPGGGFVAGVTSTIFLSDGTPGGLTQLGGDETVLSGNYVKSGNLLYFFKFEEPDVLSTTLHATDGSVAGTQERDSTSVAVLSDRPRPLVGGGIAYAPFGPFGQELRVSNGTVTGSRRIAQLESTDFVDPLLFRATLPGRVFLSNELASNFTVGSLPISFTDSPADMVVAEDAPNTTVVGMIPFNSALTMPQFLIVAGNDGGEFAVEATTGKITVANASAIDFETQSQYILDVQSSFAETGPFGYTGQVIIDVLDVVEIDLPEDIISDVIDEIQNLLDIQQIGQGQANPILNFLTQALKHIDKNRPQKAVDKLQDAIDRIVDLIDSGDLPASEGQPLIDSLQSAISLL